MIDREDDIMFQRSSDGDDASVNIVFNPLHYNRKNQNDSNSTTSTISYRSNHTPNITTTKTLPSTYIPTTTATTSNHCNTTTASIMPPQQHPLHHSYGSHSKLLPHDPKSAFMVVSNQPPPPPPTSSSSSFATSSSSSIPTHRRSTPTGRYKYLQVIMSFIGIATIFNLYTSSYLLKQRMLFSSTLESTATSLLLFPQQQHHHHHPSESTTTMNDVETSFLRLPTKRSASQQLHPNKDSTSENANEWVLPISMIENMIVQSQDYQTTQERRLVVCATNYEYIDFADNFVHHLLYNQQITNFVIVPLDHPTYITLLHIYPNHTLPAFPTTTIPITTQQQQNIDPDEETTNNDAENSFEFGSIAFRQLTASRPNFLRQILQQLHNVTIFYNDIDMVWKSNAWQVLDERIQIAQSTPIDILIQEEVESAKERRNTNAEELMMPPTKKAKTKRRRVSSSSLSSPIVTTLLWHDGPGLICTCMLYMKPTINNIQLLHEWELEILHDTTGKYLSDQDAFIAYIEKTQLIPMSHQMTTYAVRPVNTSHSSTSVYMKKKRRQPVSQAKDDVTSTTPSYITILYRNDHEFPHGHKYNWYNISTTTTRQDHHDRKSKTTKKDFLYHPNHAIIVHNNWIKGKLAKLQRFQSSGLWNPSGLL